MPTPISPTNLLVSIGSLRGQQSMQRADSALAQSIRNLSSGTRIHTGKDDPVGFIASTSLKAEISSLNQAVTNSERANSVIATVDSSLNQVNSLLNDLRGLITNAASTGSETPETLASLQIQADAIIDTINFISETTTFQGQKLLDGSLDFSTYGLDSESISLLSVHQANFQGRTEKDIVVQIHESAQQAELFYPYGVLKTDTAFTIGGTGGYSSFSFDQDATVHDIAGAVNRISDSTGVGASVFSKSNPGSIMLSSYGKNNDVLVTASEPGTAAGNFVLRYSAPREGNDELRVNVAEGDGNNPAVIEVVLQTQPGGEVQTTAEQVITLLNTSPLLKNSDGTGRINATHPTGSSGLGTVTPFAEVGYYGSPQSNNFLQFLAPEGSPPIRFVSTPNTPLSVDDSTDPPVYTNAAAQIQGFDPGTSFTVRSRTPGPEGEHVKVFFRDDTVESATYDPYSKTLTFSADFSGRAADPSRQDFSMEDLQRLVVENPDVNDSFQIVPQMAYPPDNPPTFSSEDYLGIHAQAGETTGGIASPGSIVIHLETDEHGVIKTTANDLVKFFNDPSTEESKAVLDRLGISAAAIDPTNTNLTACTIGQASFGTGVLSPTYDPFMACPPEEGYADIYFSSYGNDVWEEFAAATVLSNDSRNGDWTLTAKNAGAAFNNVQVHVIHDPSKLDPTGLNPEKLAAAYDPLLKTFTLNVDTNNPPTAAEVVEFINTDPSLNTFFAASLPQASDGTGAVLSGERAVLTGGIQPIYTHAEGTTIATDGIHSIFRVQSKKAEAQYDNTEVRVVSDTSGPNVSYDPVSKQLTVGINPSDPPTAAEVVDLINDTPNIQDLFLASLPTFAPGTAIVPDGSGFVQVGDFGMMQMKTVGTSMGAQMIGATDNESLGLVFHSVEYGSQEFVDVWATNGELPVTDRFGNAVERSAGTDIVAEINGRSAIGQGRTATSATSDLDIEVTTDPAVQNGDVLGFRISGGGALMQLGPKAVWSQQVRVSIQSVHTTALGGESGTLSQLKTGEPYSLLNDSAQAFQILEEAEIQITTMRGRLGSLQRARIDTGMEKMIDAVTISEEARSQIADTEFAAESSNLSRQQLLMQSSVAVLQQSSQTKQLLLSLLQR